MARSSSLPGVCLLLMAMTGGACHHKIVSGSRLDRDAVVETGRRISQVRGLSFLEPVKVRLSGSGDLVRAARAEAGRMRQSRKATLEGRLLAKLGLLSSGSDLASGTEAMLAKQPGGAYVPQAGRLDIFDRPYVRSEVIEALSLFAGRDLTFGEIVAHELAHALQDQHFGLDPPAWARDNSDAELAHASLVEGDAFLAGFELGLGGLVSDPEDFIAFVRNHAPDFEGEVPTYLQQRFQFPYLSGARFVLALKERAPASGWSAVDKAHRSPPRSSEEILHPEKYLNRSDPPRLPGLAAVGRSLDGFDLVFEDTLGEFGIRALLSRGGKAARATERAAGWGGDRAGLFESRRGGEQALVWIVDWDSAADAADFFDGYEAMLISRRGEPDQAGGGESRWTQGSRRRYLSLTSDRVVYLDVPAGADLYRASLAALRANRSAMPPGAPAEPKASRRSLTPEEAFEIDPRSPTYTTRGPGVRLGTESLGMTLGGLLQVSGVRGDGPKDQGLGLHGARLMLDAQAAAGLDLGLSIQLALEEPDELIRDAFLRFSPVSPHLFYLGHFQIGRMKVPVSRFRLRERAQLPLFERPVTALEWAPDRRVGFAYDLDLARHEVPIHIRVGAFDGFAESLQHGPLIATRLDVRPSDWFPGPVELSLGGAWFLDRNRAATDLDLPRDEQGLVADGRLAWGPLWLEGELFWLDREGDDALERFGWSVTLGAFALPDFLLLVARYEELDEPDGLRQQISGGLTLLYLSDRFQMMYNAIWTRHPLEPDHLQHVLRFQLRI